MKGRIRWPSQRKSNIATRTEERRLKNSESIKRDGREAPSPAKDGMKLSEGVVCVLCKHFSSLLRRLLWGVRKGYGRTRRHRLLSRALCTKGRNWRCANAPHNRFGEPSSVHCMLGRGWGDAKGQRLNMYTKASFPLPFSLPHACLLTRDLLCQ